LRFCGWGGRLGFSSQPDLFVLGVHVDAGELAQGVRLLPNADVGFGEDLTMVTLNPDVVYRLSLAGAGQVYFGGTLGLVYWDWDAGGPWLGRNDAKGGEVGAAAVLGYGFPSGELPLFLDLKIGITDEYPTLKLLAGFTIRP